METNPLGVEGVGAASGSQATTCNPKELVQKALETNKAHQQALANYAEHLAAELQELDSLIVRLFCPPYSTISASWRSSSRMPLKLVMESGDSNLRSKYLELRKR